MGVDYPASWDDVTEEAPLPWERDWLDEVKVDPYELWEAFPTTRFWQFDKPQGQREHPGSWSSLCRWLTSPMVVPHKKAAPLWSPATFKGDYRLKENVEFAYALGLDFDHLPPAAEGDPLQGLGQVYKALEDYQAIIVTTFSHSLAEPRCRAILPLSRPVTALEYEGIVRAMMAICKRAPYGLDIDKVCTDASRQWYVPSVASESAPFRALTTVPWTPLDVEVMLMHAELFEEKFAPVISIHAGDAAKCSARIALEPPAISGSQGHGQTLRVALIAVGTYRLSDDQAWAILCEYNRRCMPPWDEKRLRRKLTEARKLSRKG